MVTDCYFKTTDGLTLHGWFVPTDASDNMLVWLHGNAGNITHRLDNLKILQEYHFSIFIFDYRGYGKSEGKPSENGLYIDAESAYDFLVQTKKFSPENIVLFGRSLGGSVAVELALRRKSAGLILESSFTSMAAIARQVAPFLPTTKILKMKFNTLNKIPKINVPVLIIHGEQDELIPFSHGQKLYEAANQPKFFYPVANAGHNDLYLIGGQTYFERVAHFVTFKSMTK